MAREEAHIHYGPSFRDESVRPGSLDYDCRWCLNHNKKLFPIGNFWLVNNEPLFLGFLEMMSCFIFIGKEIIIMCCKHLSFIYRFIGEGMIMMAFLPSFVFI